MRSIKLLALLLYVAFGSARAELVFTDQGVLTRFGPLEVGDDQVLMHNGIPFSPQIVGNSRLDIDEVYEIGGRDIVLLEDHGGTACPVMLYLVTLSAAGTEATGPFGTCSEILHQTRLGDAIQIVMYGFVGPYAPESDQRRAARKHVFLFKDGVLTRDGKKVR